MVIASSDGVALMEYLESTQMPSATMTFFQTITGIKPAPNVVANALRGPSRFPGILKPDVMAPGALVLAAWPSNIKVATDQKQVALHSDYTILSGTSIACPHAAGVAALLKRAHPDWSPTAIKSAIMTTADTYDNTHNPIKDNKNNSIASPLAVGAGQIHPNQALDPGLIYDAIHRTVNFLCSMNLEENKILSITRSKKYDCSKSSSDFNYPSFVVLTSIGQNFQRIVTHVGEGATTYKGNVTLPEGSTVYSFTYKR
ncbi:hypothetical protein CMV_006069 [Castanea mollissima]|uniref:Peptidase S8/S53 domain-containing protein n=1 Tax=Castanea mollissima TaxID=60419 RepID=A0A8J4RPU6_9ROSI|nr:hypothetical protein CMV_006069 [Castanea mollissima]